MVNKLFIRHAESVYNSAVMDILSVGSTNQDHKYGDLLLDVRNFDKCGLDRESSKQLLLDANLAQAGRMNCEKLGCYMSEKFPDIRYVFCSPYKRTMLTMHHTFKNYHRKIPKENFILNPLLGDPCNLYGDYALNTINLQEEFGNNYNFDFLKQYEHPEIWFLYNILRYGSNPVTERLINRYKKSKCRQVLINDIINNSDDESPEDWYQVKNRVQLFSNYINKFIIEKNLKDDQVAVLTHSGILNFITAESFDQNHRPVNYYKFKNLEVLPANF